MQCLRKAKISNFGRSKPASVSTKMVNGNYVLYGDRPSSESEMVDDHVHSRTAERRPKRKVNRTANELQSSLNNMSHLDNDTDSVKYEKKVKEPRLLRYVPTTDVEENFVAEKFETYDMKPGTEERPRRYAFTKKAKNPTDGSINYAYSRSSSSSPNGNLPTISEHGEQYGTYRVRGLPTTITSDIPGNHFESKLDKYFIKTSDSSKKFRPKVNYNGSHPDSLYRVPNSAGAGDGKMARVLRALRWPAALIIICAALAVFVYFLMPENMESDLEVVNSTYWETGAASTAGSSVPLQRVPEITTKLPVTRSPSTTKSSKPGSTKKPLEIDFYDTDNEKNFDLISIIDSISAKKPNRKLPIAPVFPVHISPEVQYGNEKADKDKGRTPKAFDDGNQLLEDSTLKPHITQKPEKPLAIYFKDGIAPTLGPETIAKAETVNDFNAYEKSRIVQDPKRVHKYTRTQYKVKETPAPDVPSELQEYYARRRNNDSDVNFTSGHSKIFGVGIEDIDKMKSTTQSSVYNTRVSPTLPTWRDSDESTTKNYPVNLNADVPQCRSPRLALCRGVLPYDLAGPAPTIGGVELTALLTDLEYVVSANCSERTRQFVCAMLEPECNPPPFPPKRPCYALCKAVADSCDAYVPNSVQPAFNCKQYDNRNCIAARAPCSNRELACGDGTCIPRDWVCDGTNDCPAGEDEKKCTACDNNQFQCPSGGCIQKTWLCDGYVDCPEGEDEQLDNCVFVGTSTLPPPTTDAPDEELGEEGAGSAPAPSVRRPNTLPGKHGEKRRNDARAGNDDSSKELLITSDSSNALKRNFTRRPSPSRLTPYRHKTHVPLPETRSQDDEANKSTKSLIRKFTPPTTTTLKPFVETQNKESEEDTLGALNDFANEKPTIGGIFSGLPKVPPPQVVQPVVAKFSNKSDKLERVIDGAALLRKAAQEEAAEKAKLLRSPAPEVEAERDEAERRAAGRSSPCPTGELRCVDGLCITLAQLCDGTIDCSDHADEDNCFT